MPDISIKRRSRFSRRLNRLSLDFLFHQVANLVELSPYIADARRKTEITKDVPYRKNGGTPHSLDIYRPKNRKGALPVVMYIHGGGFALGSKTTHRGCALLYARLGFLVYNINYRRAPVHRFPDAISDVCHAYRWVVRHAADHGGDVNRIVVAGESAGGNLALGLLIASCFQRPEEWARTVWQTEITPAAVACIAGLLQVSDPGRFARLPQGKGGLWADFSVQAVQDVARAYLGKNAHRHDEAKILADPLIFLEGRSRPNRPLPPVFAAAGTADLICNDTERLEKALLARQAAIEARYYPKEPHVFHFLLWKKNAHLFWRDHFRFLLAHVIRR